MSAISNNDIANDMEGHNRKVRLMHTPDGFEMNIV